MAFPEVVGHLEQEMVIHREFAREGEESVVAQKQEGEVPLPPQDNGQRPQLRTIEETSEAETCYWYNCYCYLIIIIIIIEL